jgi:hypothetical protein
MVSRDSARLRDSDWTEALSRHWPSLPQQSGEVGRHLRAPTAGDGTGCRGARGSSTRESRIRVMKRSRQKSFSRPCQLRVSMISSPVGGEPVRWATESLCRLCESLSCRLCESLSRRLCESLSRRLCESLSCRLCESLCRQHRLSQNLPALHGFGAVVTIH